MSKTNHPDTPIERINWTVGADDSHTMRSRYDTWAENYDSDLVNTDNYAAPAFTVNVIKESIPASARILDAGCGTGIVGEEFARCGFTSLVGFDYSPGMLAQARIKGVYADLVEGDLNQPLPFASDSFDAVVQVGSILHIDGTCFHEFVRVLKPGGRIFFCGWAKVFEEGGFQRNVDELIAAEKLQLESVSGSFQALPVSEPEIVYRLFIYNTAA